MFAGVAKKPQHLGAPIAANIAKLPELPCNACALEQDQDCNHYRESDYSSRDPSQIFNAICSFARSSGA